MKRTVTLVGVLGLAAALSACALVDRWTGREAAPVLAEGPGQIEPVHAAAIVQDQAVFWVSSNGCTQKADLLPVVRRQGDSSVITLRRLKEDRCLEPRDQGVEISWTFQEMGLAPGSPMPGEVGGTGSQGLKTLAVGRARSVSPNGPQPGAHDLPGAGAG